MRPWTNINYTPAELYPPRQGLAFSPLGLGLKLCTLPKGRTTLTPGLLYLPSSLTTPCIEIIIKIEDFEKV